MERGQRCEAKGHKGKRDEGDRMRSAEKGERKKEGGGAAKERDKEKSVGMVRGERNTPGTPNHGIVEPLGPGPCLTRVS